MKRLKDHQSKILTGAACLMGAGIFTYYSLNAESHSEDDQSKIRTSRSATSFLQGYSDEFADTVTLDLEHMSEWATDNWFQDQLDRETDSVFDFFDMDNDDVNFFQQTGQDARKKKPPKKGTGFNEEMATSMVKLFEEKWMLVDLSLQALDVHPVYPKKNENVHKGFDDTSGAVEELTESFRCSGDNVEMFSGKHGPVELTVLLPTDPIMYATGQPTEDNDGNRVFYSPVKDYSKYVEFAQAYVDDLRSFSKSGGTLSPSSGSRFNIGSYTYNTMRLNFRGRIGHKSFWNLLDNQAVNSLAYPKATIKVIKGEGPTLMVNDVNIPKVSERINSMLFNKKNTASTPFVANTNVILWIMSTAPDLAAHSDPDFMDSWQELRSNAVVVPIGVGIRSDIWEKFMAFLLPEIQELYAKDYDFSGHFLLDNVDQLKDSSFIQTINNYLCLTVNRASCRITRKGDKQIDFRAALNQFDVAVSTAEPAWLDPDYKFDPSAYENKDWEDQNYYGDEDLERLVAEEEVEFEANSCCGHDMYQARSYDSRYQECCWNGRITLLTAEDEPSSCPEPKE